jgi:hypothetical protein
MFTVAVVAFLSSLRLVEIPFYLSPIILFVIFLSIRWSFFEYRGAFIRSSALLFGLFGPLYVFNLCGLVNVSGIFIPACIVFWLIITGLIYLYDLFVEDFLIL